MPAILYADQVNVLCPQSDDALEASDYFDLGEALPTAVNFVALDTGYPRRLRGRESLPYEHDDIVYEPVSPEIWRASVQESLSAAEAALNSGDREEALNRAAYALALAHGAFSIDVAGAISNFVQASDQDFVRIAEELSYADPTQKAARAARMAYTYRDLMSQPRSYGLIDDPAGLLYGATADVRTPASEWARIRNTEAALGVALLRRLPSPKRTEPWTVIADVKSKLEAPLKRFRTALASVSEAADTDRLEEDFDGFVEHTWRTQVSPALDELEELARQSSFRSVFFEEVSGDLSAYAGPLIGLSTAMTDTLPAFLSAAIGAASPVASTVAHRQQRRRELRRHDFLFLREAAQRMSRS